MQNPWLKKNPFMSMWLSAFNTGLGHWRGQAASAASAMTTAGAKEIGAAMAAGPAKRRRKAATTRPGRKR